MNQISTAVLTVAFLLFTQIACQSGNEGNSGGGDSARIEQKTRAPQNVNRMEQAQNRSSSDSNRSTEQAPGSNLGSTPESTTGNAPDNPNRTTPPAQTPQQPSNLAEILINEGPWCHNLVGQPNENQGLIQEKIIFSPRNEVIFQSTFRGLIPDVPENEQPTPNPDGSRSASFQLSWRLSADSKTLITNFSEQGINREITFSIAIQNNNGKRSLLLNEASFMSCP